MINDPKRLQNHVLVHATKTKESMLIKLSSFVLKTLSLGAFGLRMQQKLKLGFNEFTCLNFSEKSYYIILKMHKTLSRF